MSGAKFYVWGGGRWREVCEGRVEGWGPARFVCVRGGRLALASRARVQRGLRALAAGRPAAVRDGPPLSQIRVNIQPKDVDRERREKREKREGREDREGREGREGRKSPEGCAHCREHCCRAPPAHHHCRCVSDANFNRLLRTDASVQVCRTSPALTPTPVPAPAPTPAPAPAPAPEPHKLTDRKITNTVSRRKGTLKRTRPTGDDGPLAKRKHRAATPQSQAQSDDVCTELIIEEDTIALLRGFVERGTHAHVFHVDLLRFDEDDEYKRLVFFRLNPLVKIARSRRVDRMIREQDALKKDFASLLGLQSVDERSSQEPSSYRTRTKALQKRRNDAKRRSHVERFGSVDSGTDKENRGDESGPSRVNGDASGERRAVKGAASRLRKKKEDAVVMSSDSKESEEEARNLRHTTKVPAKLNNKTTVVAKKGIGKSGREYSRLEDEAIVRWVRGGSRARLVNGNRLWRELPPLHQQRTGRWRSWHSLRNRYLRYLLPRLGALSLPPADAARLRAAAASGEIKSRKAPPRRNSLLVEPRVRSAWARRPRPPRTPSPAHSLSPTPPPARTPSLPRAHSPSSYGPSAANSTDSNDSATRTSSGDRKRKKRKLDDGVQAKHPPRTLRSSTAASPAPPAHTRALRHTHAHTHAPAPAHTRTPTYAQLTRRFASPRASSDSEPLARAPAPAPRAPAPRTPAPRAAHSRRLYNPKDAL